MLLTMKIQDLDSHTDNTDMMDDRRVLLNVGGWRHETTRQTLKSIPCSRLAKLMEETDSKANGVRNIPDEFYFDRHPELFSYILNFYRTGELHFPHTICGPIIKAELIFWELDEQDIAPCCWVGYNSYAETQEALGKFRTTEKEDEALGTADPSASWWQRVRPQIWAFFENPNSSRMAKAYAWFSLIVVWLSIAVYCLETYAPIQVDSIRALDIIRLAATRANRTRTSIPERTTPLEATIQTPDASTPPHNMRNKHSMDLEHFYHLTIYGILLLIDHVCNGFFFIEFVVRFIASPKKLRFLSFPITIIEILCIVPYYIGVLLIAVHPNSSEIEGWLSFLYFWRILRIFRSFVIMKHFHALKILLYTLRASTKELLLLIVILIIGVVLFACLAYVAESSSLEQDQIKIDSIPMGFWWAVVTMTTVGYGDVYPKSTLGHIVGALCVTSGVLVIALTVPIIVNNFTVYYTYAQSTSKLNEKRREQTRSGKSHRRKSSAFSTRSIISANQVAPSMRKSIPKNDICEMQVDELPLGNL